jgi:hypothetical protein
MTQATFYTTIDTFDAFRNQKLINAGFDIDQVLNDVYYDGELICYLLSDFFGTTTPYYTRADNSYHVYRTNYAVPSSYQLPGFWCFTQGWIEGFLRRGIAAKVADTDALMAVDGGRYMFPGSPGLNAEGRTPENRHEINREFAYCIINLLQQSRVETLSAPQITLLHQRVADSLTICDDWAGTMQASYFRYFMGSITSHALISFFESSFATADEKAAILTNLIQLAEYANSSSWDAGDLAFNYTDRDVGNPDDLTPQPTLNMLGAPWFAWLWTQTFEEGWKTRADEIFEGGEPHYSEEGFWISGAYLGGMSAGGVLGKEVDQQLVWGYKYFDYTAVVPPTPVPPGPGTEPTSHIILFNVFQ